MRSEIQFSGKELVTNQVFKREATDGYNCHCMIPAWLTESALKSQALTHSAHAKLPHSTIELLPANSHKIHRFNPATPNGKDRRKHN